MHELTRRLNSIFAVLQSARFHGIAYQITLVALAMLFVLSGTLLVGADALTVGSQALTLEVGQVAPEDIRAPFSVSYESAVLTEQARQLAMDSVRDIYDPPDPSVVRQQVQLARQILDYIADVRSDEYATPEMLREDIRAINAISLSDDEIDAILNTPPDRWAEIDQQIMTVLERAMRGEIRDDTLRSVRQNLPNLVSVRFRVDEVALITSIVEDLIRTNTFYNEELTRQAREAAAEAVAPSQVEIRQGQVVVNRGSVITEADIEALTQLGIFQPHDRRLQALLSAFLLMLLITFIFGFYLNRFYPAIAHDPPFMILLGVIFILALAGARMSGPERAVQPYLYPSAALGLLLTTLAGPQIAIVGTTALAVLFGVMADGSLPLTAMAALGGAVGVLTLRDTARINSYFVAGGLVGLANIVVVLVFYLTGFPVDTIGALTLIGAGLINGLLAAAITLGGLYLFGSLFNIPTSVRLIELTQPNQPLLQRLLREAPGTYQHSLQVANLAELAAERVGANATLTRVGALYHDVGKIKAPHFFVENQVDGVNPHEALNDPEKSARIIIDHVIEGERLARKYRLPARVIDFILEHHGTTRPMYFYRRAVEQAGGDEDAVETDRFTYPGPRPRSRETAILMLADSSESTVRARRPRNKQEIADVIKYVFDLRMSEGQLDESGLTLRDISVIQNVFVETLQGVFHPRIAYAGVGEVAQKPPAAEATPAVTGASSAAAPSAAGEANPAQPEQDVPPPKQEKTRPIKPGDAGVTHGAGS